MISRSLAVDGQHPPDDRRVSTEAPLPVAEGQHDCRRTRRAYRPALKKPAPACGGTPQNGQDLARDEQRLHLLRAIEPRHRRRAGAPQPDILQRAALVAIREVEIRRRRESPRQRAPLRWRIATSRSASGYGRGLSSTSLTMVKIAVFAPMPIASVASTAVVTPGVRRSERMPNRMLRQSVSSAGMLRSSRCASRACASPPMSRRAARRASSADRPRDTVFRFERLEVMTQFLVELGDRAAADRNRLTHRPMLTAPPVPARETGPSRRRCAPSSPLRARSACGPEASTRRTWPCGCCPTRPSVL